MAEPTRDELNEQVRRLQAQVEDLLEVNRHAVQVKLDALDELAAARAALGRVLRDAADEAARLEALAATPWSQVPDSEVVAIATRPGGSTAGWLRARADAIGAPDEDLLKDEERARVWDEAVRALVDLFGQHLTLDVSLLACPYRPLTPAQQHEKVRAQLSTDWYAGREPLALGDAGFPHSVKQTCGCDGCWQCAGYVVGCACDINFAALAARVMKAQGAAN